MFVTICQYVLWPGRTGLLSGGSCCCSSNCFAGGQSGVKKRDVAFQLEAHKRFIVPLHSLSSAVLAMMKGR